ncbi:two-component system activity regulator YycH [Sutcliffiella horikoshii]|uniref:YycH family regulatory protein n=1 Tax=Sutcliffiella horikoshii TaxID=79883 RepID=UPI00203C5867|nr:two-component system activity regulator YycH [Sutcliffiella horikoshii]MCM3618212.1 two-component system activity regulator YycH [Sutcliffiella horikoshii]
MSYETIKSLILTFLVLLSLVLTWNLWTYQPDYEYINSDRVISDVEIREKREINQIVKPSHMLFHFEDEHHGNVDTDRFLNEFKNWSLFDIERVDDIENGEFTSFMHGNRKMEVVFPDDIPLQTFRYLTSLDNEIPDNIFINRILIDFNVISEGSEQTIFLVNYEEKEVYSARVSNLSFNQLERSFYQTAKTNPRYLSLKAENDRYVFFPALDRKEEQIRTYKYFTDQLNPEDFKDALFSDPSIVTKDMTLDAEVYRDDSRLMRVTNHDYKLQYVNPGNTGQGNTLDFNVIEQGIEFVNNHSGWTGPVENFKLEKWNRSTLEDTVSFRMFVGDHPVFNFNGNAITEIAQSWRTNELREYVRPTFEFGIIVPGPTQKQLPSGKEVTRQLEKMNVDLSAVTDIKIAYELKREQGHAGIITIDPIWVYQEGNTTWTKMTFAENDDLEGGM